MRCDRCGAEDPVAYRRAGSLKTGKPLCLNERDLSKSCWHIDKAGGRMPDVVDRLLASQGTWESDDGFGHDWVPSEIVLEAAHTIRSLRERVAELDRVPPHIRQQVEAASRGAVGRVGHSEAVSVQPPMRMVDSVADAVKVAVNWGCGCGGPVQPYRLGDSDGTRLRGSDEDETLRVLRRAAGVGGPFDAVDTDVEAAWLLCETLERRLGQIDVGPDLRTGDRVLVVDLFGSFFHALRATLVNAAARKGLG